MPSDKDNRRERVAEIIYDWIHENQVTHRRAWSERREEDKAQYRVVAASIAVVYETELERLQLQTEALTGSHIRDVLKDEGED